jgi:hypothetical protein
MLDIHESVQRDIMMKVINKLQLYRLFYYFWSALHVSSDVFAHYQEHLPVFTASGSVHPSYCRLVFWINFQLVDRLFIWTTLIWTVLLDMCDMLHCKWFRSHPQTEDGGSDMSV